MSPCVGYIQSAVISFPEAQIQLYMKNVRYIILKDRDSISEAYEFIRFWSRKGIRKFVLALPSGELLQLSKRIQNDGSLDCIVFIATNSNASLTRTEITNKNIYFSLSDIRVLTNNFSNLIPGRGMTIVSRSSNPYYIQIYEEGTTPKYWLDEVTVEKINQFAKTGAVIFSALETVQDYQYLVGLLLDPSCSYTRQLAAIELSQNQVPIVSALFSKLSSVYASSCGVGLSAINSSLPLISNATRYNNTSVSLVNSPKNWKSYICLGIIGKGTTVNYGTNYLELKTKQN